MPTLSHSLDSLLIGLRAAADASRLRLLAICAQGEWTVTELTQVLGQSQPRVSRHLKLLADAGLLERFREGSWVFYRRARAGTGARLARSLCRMLPADDPDLALDRQRLAAVRAARQEQAAQYFAAQAGRWDEVRSLYVDEAKVETALLGAFGEHPPRNLLDIGTGTGRVLQLFAPRIGFGLGIDLSREMLSVARANLDRTSLRNCQVRHGDMYHLPLPDGFVRSGHHAQRAAFRRRSGSRFGRGGAGPAPGRAPRGRSTSPATSWSFCAASTRTGVWASLTPRCGAGSPRRGSPPSRRSGSPAMP